jgi:hypothetical protein
VEARNITLTITQAMDTRMIKGTRATMGMRRERKAIIIKRDTMDITANMVDIRNLIMMVEVIMVNTIRVKKERKGTNMANTGSTRRATQQKERTKFTNSMNTRSTKISTTNTMMRVTIANMADTTMNTAQRREDTIRAAITSRDITMTITVRRGITTRDTTLTNTRATKVLVATRNTMDTMRTMARREVMMTTKNGATAMGTVGITVKLSHFLPSFGPLVNCTLWLLWLSWGTPSHKSWSHIIYKRYNY